MRYSGTVLSRYKLLLPSEAELKAQWLRELKSIGPAAAARLNQAKKKTKPGTPLSMTTPG